MKLYYHPASPNGRRAIVTLRHLGLEAEEIVVNFQRGDLTTPEYTKTPFGPKSTTKIKVGYNAAAAGHFDKDVFVKISGIAEPKPIKITGDVLNGTEFDAYVKTGEYKKAEKARLAQAAKEAKDAKKSKKAQP